MSIDFPIYKPDFLYRVMYDQRFAAPSTYWLDLLFPQTYASETGTILFEKISSSRKIAPFGMPNVPGKPTYKALGSTLTQFEPAYIKPKDAVNPGELRNRQPGNLFGPPMSLRQKYDARVADITQFQRSIIQRRWEWMAAKAAMDGAVTISGPGYPTVTVDFGRAANHTVTLAGGSRWGDTDISIYASIQGFMDRMANAPFGGVPNRMTIGTKVLPVLMADKDIKDHMSTIQKGETNTKIVQGLYSPITVQEPARFVGTISGLLDVYVYDDWYQDDSGAQVKYMNSTDVVFTAPNFEGWKCFGAIQDINALVPTDIFTKMWDEDDPSGRFIMSQSAPLMVPVNPNCSLKATVVA